VLHQHEATHQTNAAGCFISRVTVACDNYRLPLIVCTRPIHHTYMWSVRGQDKIQTVVHQGPQFFGTLCPQQSQKWGAASVESLMWQHLQWTTEVGQGHNWYEHRDTAHKTWWQWGCGGDTMDVWSGEEQLLTETAHCTMQHHRWPETQSLTQLALYVHICMQYVHTFT
jgi:hypothetical protein